MPEKKRQEKVKFVPELEKSITEISVAKRRSFEPFIKTFSSTGENVTKLDLGTLVGVFEVSERSEDSAYIVNFLASVARKEYFQNPRRGAVESFEAALQKVNLALAELVKHGNIAWLGELHGALGVFEKNNMHFSVTGETRILLLRNESISDISEGLASEESHIHPIKTFVEVSSGRLAKDDKILLATPGVFSLFPIEILQKNALRMGKEKFIQFLKTALVNELDVAGILLIDIEEKPKEARLSPAQQAKKATAKASASHQNQEPSMVNVFSGKTFEPGERPSLVEDVPFSEKIEPATEYVDSKTGHIYVQGEVSTENPPHPILEHVSLWMKEGVTSLYNGILSQQKLIRKARKKLSILKIALTDAAEESISAAAQVLEKKREQQRILQAEKKQAHEREMAEKKTQAVALPQAPKPQEPSLPIEPPLHVHSEEETPLQSPLATFYQKGERSTLSNKRERNTLILKTPSFKILASLSPLKENTRKVLQNGWGIVVTTTKRLFLESIRISKKASQRFQSLSTPMKRGVLASLCLIALLCVTSVYFIASKQSTPKEASSSPEDTPVLESSEGKKNDFVLHTLTSVSGTIIDFATLNDEIFVVTSSKVINTQSGKEYTIPSSTGAIILATPMKDLGLLFLVSDQNEVFSFSPIGNNNFSKNNLPVPENTTISSAGTYLTYLYTLDQKNNQIYRFPRAEGGFGESTTWLKESITTTEKSQIAINEKVFLTLDGGTVTAFFRGKKEKDFQIPGETSFIEDISVSSESGKVLALDTKNSRVIIWDQEGNLLGEYSSPKLSLANHIAFREKTNEVIFSEGSTLSSLKIQE
ncbi:MAG: hypothetical protein AAB519_01945 [Patescibacteria group bacterium]